MEPQRPASPGPGSVSAQNVAMGDAKVGQQIGRVETQYVDVVHETTVYGARDDTPQDNLDAACYLLDASAPRTALVKLEAVIAADHWTIDVAYRLALAIVSGRAFDHLSNEDFDRLKRAFRLAHRQQDDDRAAALLAIEELLGCFIAQESRPGGVEPGRIDAALLQYGALPGDLRAELGRHLRMMLHGAVQDGLDEQRRADIKRNRLGRDRTRRVPLFFDPDPAPPRRPAPLPRQAGLGRWLLSAFGAALAVTGLFWTAPAFRDRPVLGLCILLTCLAGVAGVLWAGLDCYYLNRRRAAAEAEDRLHRATAEVRPAPADDFAAGLRTLIRRHFRQAALPADPLGFLADTAAVRVRLERELIDVYGGDLVQPGEVEWLVRWHAEQAARRWAATGGDPIAHPFQMTVGRYAVAVVSCLAVAAGVLAALAVRLGDDVPAGLVAVAVVSAGGALLRNAVFVYIDARRHAEEAHQQETRATDEWSGHEDERRRLIDRPRDDEMARWLDYDRDWVKFRAMKQYGLTNRDLITHVVITEPATGCRRARQANGPTRYSAYSIRLFLLTGNGVRQLDVLLDFIKGSENKERRNAYRYDAIASVEIEEPTVRPHGRNQVASEEGGGPAGPPPKPILRQALTLTLLNGPPIKVRNDYVSQLPDEQREDRSALESLAMDTSGAISALRTLESVAADGQDWIARERERTRRQIDDYVERVGVVG